MYLLDAPADAVPTLRATLAAPRRLAGRGRGRADLERARARGRRGRGAGGRGRGGPAAPDPGHPLPGCRAGARPASCPRTAGGRRRWWPARGWPRCSRRPARRSCAAVPAAARPPPSCSPGCARPGPGTSWCCPTTPTASRSRRRPRRKARDEGLRVAVIPTRASVQALAALAVHDLDRRFEDDVVAMTAAAGHCRHGGVTVGGPRGRDDGRRLPAGDVLGIVGRRLRGDRRRPGDGRAHRAGPDARLRRRARHAGDRRRPEPGLAEAVAEHARDGRPEVDTVQYDGGQPRYPLLIGVE